MVTNYAIYENNEWISHEDKENNEWTSHENKEVESVQPVHLNFYRSNAYRKEFSWLHFYNEPRVHEKHQKLDQQANISFSETYLACSSSS